MPTKLNPFYLIVSRFRDSQFIPEQFVEKSAFDAIVTDICAGHYEDVDAVLYISPSVEAAVNVTRDVMRQAMTRYLHDNDELSYGMRSMLEDHLGCRVVADAERMAA